MVVWGGGVREGIGSGDVLVGERGRENDRTLRGTDPPAGEGDGEERGGSRNC